MKREKIKKVKKQRERVKRERKQVQSMSTGKFLYICVYMKIINVQNVIYTVSCFDKIKMFQFDIEIFVLIQTVEIKIFWTKSNILL